MPEVELSAPVELSVEAPVSLAVSEVVAEPPVFVLAALDVPLPPEPPVVLDPPVLVATGPVVVVGCEVLVALVEPLDVVVALLPVVSELPPTGPVVSLGSVLLALVQAARAKPVMERKEAAKSLVRLVIGITVTGRDRRNDR